MASIESTYEADLCGNCIVWHFNADDSGVVPSDPRPMRYWDEDATVGHYTVELVEDAGEPVQHFSHRDCDGCGAIAGTRYEAVIHYDDLRTVGA